MIAKLTGVIDFIADTYVIIDVNGVGYQVAASSRTLSKIGDKGNRVSLYIETVVREDAINLFGFADGNEKQWFEILTSVQGVGAKVALAILSVIDATQLPLAIASGDKAMIQQADGVGAKLATRIVTELKDKAGKLAIGVAQTAGPVLGKGKVAAIAGVAAGQGGARGDAVLALVNLGYGRAEAFGAVANAARTLDNDEDVGLLIKESLKELSA